LLKTLQFITSNIHKFSELTSYLSNKNFSRLNITVEHLNQKYTELQADTIWEVAHASASSLATIMNQDFIIEDSGMAVSHLNGFPGPYSSFVFQTLGWKGILALLNEVQDRSASFTSVFVLCIDKKLWGFEGKVTGSIALNAGGNSGFGFDPIFIPDGQSGQPRTMAEMEMVNKNRSSHRGKSLELLVDYLARELT